MAARARSLWFALAVALLLAAPSQARSPGALMGERVPDWVLRAPGPETQVTKRASERGINPCMSPDPGFGAFTEWDRAPGLGQMIRPVDAPRGDEFDVMFHFHGHEAARKQWVQVVQKGVLVGIDMGVGSGPYMKGFENPQRFRSLLASVEKAMAKRMGRQRMRARRVGLSSWSAGYGAVEQILRTPFGRDRVDAVILLDGLHTGVDSSSLGSLKLAPFVDFARRASQGKRFMFVSHSSIIPPGYASTTQTARYLVWKLGGTPTAVDRRPYPMGLELIESYSKGNFHVRGFSGNDTLDHCAQLAMLGAVLEHHIAPRWSLTRR